MKKEDVIIISDLHLNEGVNSPNEDFFYDEEFSRFLKSLKKKTKLIINGDFVDFLQVVELPTKTAGLRRSEIIYGLNTEEEKSVWKLRYVIHNHRIFFNALIDFVIKGNKIVIIKGNHDVEFFWPRVKQSFYQELNKIMPHKNIKNNIEFKEWFYYEKGLLYVEHGNQYDEINSFCNFLNPVLSFNKKELELPLGSFFVRYFFNRIEKIDPFADNIKPSTRYIRWVIIHRPLLALRVIWQYFPMLFKTSIKARRHSRDDNYNKVCLLNNKELKRLAAKNNISYEKLKKIDELKLAPLMEKSHFIFRAAFYHVFEHKIYHDAAKKIKRLLNVKYVAFGHTHNKEASKSYFNTGTWTPRVYHEFTQLQTVKNLTYLKISNGKASLLEWK